VSEENQILDRIEVEEILQKLEPSSREIFELHHILGFTFEELAPKYNTTPGTIRSKLSKALMKIRKLISEKTEQIQK
jgi:RNA polymerase sigma factor (sigma-70 family)